MPFPLISFELMGIFGSQNFVSKDEIREAIVRAMLPAEGHIYPKNSVFCY